ncbi:MAG: Npt1/Npt2 family nucleotide transporter, partial [Kofleriaceae bacterium]
MAEQPKKKSPLDWFLNLFAEVKAGEGLVALLLLLALFLILASYYVLKTAREGLILGDDIWVPFLGEQPGTEVKIGAGGAMALLMLAIVPLYGRLASKVPRKRLLDVSYALIVGSLTIFFLMDRAGFVVGLGFFIWLGIVNMFIIAQFWSYANDLYTEEQGKRLFAVIAIGGSLGAIVGPKLKKLSSVAGMMVIAAGILVAVILILGVIDRLANKAKPSDAARAPLKKDGGFELVLRDRYLLLIGVMLIFANLVNTTGEFILGDAFTRYAEAAIPADAADRSKLLREMIGGYYADFFFWVNLVGFFIQTLLTSRIIKYAGIRTALFVMPAIALAGYGTIGLIGGLTLIRIAKIAENSVDYSLQNTVRQSLFLPTSREVKYKAKAAIDTFFVRFGDTAAALVVLGGIQLLGLDARSFAFINVGVLVLWLLVAFAIARRHK